MRFSVLLSHKRSLHSPPKSKYRSPPKSKVEIPGRSVLGHLWGHKPFEGILEDVLEDVFGLPPRPQIGGHDGPGTASHPTETPKTKMRMGCVLKRVLWMVFVPLFRRRAAPQITKTSEILDSTPFQKPATSPKTDSPKISYGVYSPSPKTGSPKNDKKSSKYEIRSHFRIKPQL